MTSLSDPKCCSGDASITYSDSAVTARDANDVMAPTVLQALEKVKLNKSDEAFVIGEFGSADGGNSMDLLMRCIDKIKTRHGNQQEVVIVYEDKADNDFRPAFKRVQETLISSDISGVYVASTGTNFYRQCVASDTVHLGFCAMSLMWLSRRPGPLDGATIFLSTKNTAQAQLFADQAAADWELFLLSRAKEMKKGGHFVSVTLCRTDHATHDLEGYVRFHNQFRDIWYNLATEGAITQEEASNFVIDQYLRTEAEFRAPFTPGSVVTKTGLQLESYTPHLVTCQHHRRWLATEDKGLEAARAFAKRFIDNIRAWSYSYLMSSLNDDRSLADRQSIVDEAYSRLEDHMTGHPGQCHENFGVALIVIKKE